MNSRRGFTLLELLVVMGIMVLVMGISAMGFQGIRRGAEVRGAVMSIRTTMMLARQQAVTKRLNMKVTLHVAQKPVMITVVNAVTGIGYSTNYLTPGVEVQLGDPAKWPVVYTPSGATSESSGHARLSVTVKEVPSKGYPNRTVWIYPLTGATKEE